MEVQEALVQERLKFTGVGIIELIWFPDSSLNGAVEAIGKSAESVKC